MNFSQLQKNAKEIILTPDQLKRLQDTDDPFNKLLGTNQLLDAVKHDLNIQENMPISERSFGIKDIDEAYKNDAYWALPPNVRNAIDIAKQKSTHSEFFYRLQNLNDKIFVYRGVFYGRIPSFQKSFLLKKEKDLIDRINSY